MSFAQLPDRVIARVAAFSLVGAINSVVGIGLIVIAGLLGVGPIWANVLGYSVGLIISFTLNSRVTFGRRAANRSTALRFLGAFVVALVVDLVVVNAVTGIAGEHKLLGSLAGTPIYMGLFYVLCEYWVFRVRDADTDATRT